VHALYDGDRLSRTNGADDRGRYTTFAHLETLHLGTPPRRTLSRPTSCTRSRRRTEADHLHGRRTIITAADGDATRPTSPDRSPVRRWAVTTDEQASWWGGRGPAPSACADQRLRRRHRARGAQVRRVGPRGLQHRCAGRLRERLVRTALDVARALGPRLWGVRLDTSEALVDRSLWDQMGRLRADRRQTRGSSGTSARPSTAKGSTGSRSSPRAASLREDRGGSSARASRSTRRRGLLAIRGSNDYRDIVLTDGEPSAKVGRRYRPNPRLELVDSGRPDPLGRRYAGRLHAPGREAVRRRRRGDDPGQKAARRGGRARPGSCTWRLPTITS